MINLACGVIQILNKCSCPEIFVQQDNLNLTFLVVMACHLVSELFFRLISYHLISEVFL